MFISKTKNKNLLEWQVLAFLLGFLINLSIFIAIIICYHFIEEKKNKKESKGQVKSLSHFKNNMHAN